MYFWVMRSASALRFSNGCSSLNFGRILDCIVADVLKSQCRLSRESCLSLVKGRQGRVRGRRRGVGRSGRRLGHSR